jgi:hypothetical protein
MVFAVVFRRFEMELYDTNWERDIKVVRDCLIGEQSSRSTGVKIKFKGFVNAE